MAYSSQTSLAVEAHDLVKVFPRGNVRALDGVSLEVEAGTVLGLLGPNGAGKTRVGRILSTILRPGAGPVPAQVRGPQARCGAAPGRGARPVRRGGREPDGPGEHPHGGAPL